MTSKPADDTLLRLFNVLHISEKRQQTQLSEHKDPHTISLNARPLSSLLSLLPSSHSGQKIEDTHQALTDPSAAVAPQSPC